MPGGLRGERLIKTGLISVATSPPGAAIDIDGRRQPLVTPAVLRNLKPGEYALTISMPGHRPWSGRVPVEAERAVTFEKILLIPDAPEAHLVHAGPFRALRPMPGTPFVLVFRGPALKDALVVDARNEKARPLFSPDAVFASAKLQSLHTIDGSDRLFVVARTEGVTRYLWARVEREETRVSDITHLFPEAPPEPRWDADRPEEIFFEVNGYLSRVHPESAAVYPKFLNGLKGFGLADGRLYAIEADGAFVRALRDGTDREPAVEEPLPSAFLKGAGSRFRAENVARGAFLFLSDTGSLLSNLYPYELAERGVEGLVLDRASRRALFWTRDSVGWADFSPEAEGLSAAEARWVVRGGRRVTQAAWVYEGSHVLFTDRGRAYLVETGAPGKPRILELFGSRKDVPFAWVEEEGAAYHLDRKTGALVRTRLFRRPAILPLSKSRDE